MKVVALPDAEPRPRRLAVGTFDGVHLGHREVIAGADTVLTFEPHPRAVLRPPAPPLLTALPVKAELVADLGVGELVLVPFDEAFARLTADAFVADVLVGRLAARMVAVGENFRFGWKAQGDAEMLQADPRFETRVEPLLEVDGEIVSSSHIRGLLLSGAVEEAGRLLGDPFTVLGEVAHGDKRGRTLGYPTANLVPDPTFVTPGHGVYACRAGILGPDAEAWFAAAVNVGVRPQFVTGRGELIEAYLVDFEGDLYGRRLRLEFRSRLRGERRFESVDALVEQMGRDVEAAATLGRSS